jgi:hypothetical protein
LGVAERGVGGGGGDGPNGLRICCILKIDVFFAINV